MDSNEGKTRKITDSSDSQFSKLPDELLGLIISNLSTKEAVSTSLLSRRWRYQWKYLSRLDFEIEEKTLKINSKKSQVFYLKELLNQLISVSVKTCLITHHGCQVLEHCNNRLKYTVAYLLYGLGTEELAIKKYDDVSNDDLYNREAGRIAALVGLLDDFFVCENRLRKLELDGYWISNEKLLSTFGNLETLKLCRVTFGGEANLGNIISVCGLLENLVIEDCSDLITGLRIGYDMRIKSLEINRCALHDFFDIHVETLQCLSLYSSTNFSWHNCVIQCPNLRVLQIHCGSISSRFPIPIPRSLVSNPVCHFPILMVLRTTVDLNRIWHILILRRLFRHCTKLQVVDIFNEADRDDDGIDYIPHEASIWRREFCESIVCQLRVFRIKGFSGREREMGLVDYLITSATRLKKLVIQFDKVTSQPDAIKQQILSLPRSSLHVSIIFDI